jgi:hypothetical protein
MTNKQPPLFSSRDDLVKNIVEKVLAMGSHTDGKHTVEIGPGDVVWVREASGKGVAFSSTKADFDQSLVEFVTDYFG